MPKQSSKSTASKKVTTAKLKAKSSAKLKALDNLFNAMKNQAVYELTDDARFEKANVRSALLFNRYIKTKGPDRIVKVESARLCARLKAFAKASLGKTESNTFDAYEKLYDSILVNESKKLK